MDLNIDIKDIKGQIQELLGKFSKSSSSAPEESEMTEVSQKKQSPDMQKMLKPLTSFFGKYSYDHETILGVNITPHYVRVCQMKNAYDKWMLNNLASSCMENQFRKDDIQVSSDLYVENLRDLIQKNGIKAKNVAFALPTSSSVVKVLNVPDMNEDDFAEAAALGSIWESMVELEGDVSEYSIYYKILRHNPAPVEEESPQEETSEAVIQEDNVVGAVEDVAEVAPTDNIDVANPEDTEMEVVADEVSGEVVSEEIPVENAVEEVVVVEDAPVADNLEGEGADVEAPMEVPSEGAPAETDENNQTDVGTVAAAEGAPAAEAAIISEPIEGDIPVEEPTASEVVSEDVVVEEPVLDSVGEVNVEDQAEVAVNTEELPVVEEASEVPVEAAPAVDEIVSDEIAIEAAPEAPAVEAPAVEEVGVGAEAAIEDIGIEPEIDTSAVAEDVAIDAVGIDAELGVVEEPMISGPTMDVLFVASKLVDINLHADIIRRAGLNPVLADVGCLSLKHAFESNPKNFNEVREPYAFLEFGPDENYVFVVDGDNTNIYNVFVSDDDKNAMIYSADNIDLINSFAQNSATQIVQILDEHKAKYKTQTINHVFVSSSAPLHVDDASVEPLIKIYVREVSKHLTGRKVTECSFLSHIAVPEKFAKKVNAEGDISAWASTVGIATRKLDIFGYEADEGVADINMVNLLPESNDNKKNKRTSIMSTFALSIVFLLTLLQIGVLYLSITSKGAALADEIKSMSDVEGKYNTKFSEAQKLSLIVNQVNSLDDVKESLPSNQSSILSAYRHVTSVIPEGVWLSEVNYIVPAGIEIKGSSVSDGKILTFIKKLNEGKEFQRIVLKTMEMEKAKASSRGLLKGEVKNFTLEGSIMENVSMQGLEMISNGVKK